MYCNENSPQQQEDSISNYPSEENEKNLSRKINKKTTKEDQYYNPANDSNYREQAKYSEYKESNPVEYLSPQESRKDQSPKHTATRRSEKSESQSRPTGHRSTKSKSPIGPKSRKSPGGLSSSTNFSKADNEVNKTTKNKSKLKFVCPESPCEKNNMEDLEYYQQKNAVEPSRQTMQKKNGSSSYPDKNYTHNSNPSFNKPVQHNRKSIDPAKIKRPNTSPYEKTARQDYVNKTPARKFRSETTMKEIEKALRNYDQRLNGLEFLESKIEKLKEKLSESNRRKHELLIEKDERKKQKASEREKSSREITKLCSENWELKLQVQRLAAKSDVQYKKTSDFKIEQKKVKELESEAEDLKKELSEYQDSFQDQRKCITMLESVVAVQRTEIEKLMNLIKKLTTMDRVACCQDRRNIQRSRSYSPESRRPKRTYCRPKVSRYNAYNASSDEDCTILCCEDYYQQHDMRRNHQKNFDRRLISPEPGRRLGWCVN